MKAFKNHLEEVLKIVDDSEIVELYLKRDESAISNTQEKYGQKLRLIANGILNDMKIA